jgi:hypothetical protein
VETFDLPRSVSAVQLEVTVEGGRLVVGAGGREIMARDLVDYRAGRIGFSANAKGGIFLRLLIRKINVPDTPVPVEKKPPAVEAIGLFNGRDLAGWDEVAGDWDVTPRGVAVCRDRNSLALAPGRYDEFRAHVTMSAAGDDCAIFVFGWHPGTRGHQVALRGRSLVIDDYDHDRHPGRWTKLAVVELAEPVMGREMVVEVTGRKIVVTSGGKTIAEADAPNYVPGRVGFRTATGPAEYSNLEVADLSGGRAAAGDE